MSNLKELESEVAKILSKVSDLYHEVWAMRIDVNKSNCRLIRDAEEALDTVTARLTVLLEEENELATLE